jgi:surfeit locus 1 family protein
MRRIIPILMFILMEITLIGLGVWQLQRMAWKEALLEQRRVAIDAEPLNFFSSKSLADSSAYRRVNFKCNYDIFSMNLESGFDSNSNIADRIYVRCDFKGAPSIILRGKWQSNHAPTKHENHSGPKVAFASGPMILTQLAQGRLLPWPSTAFYDSWIGAGIHRKAFWQKTENIKIADYFVQSGDTLPPPPPNNHFAYAMQWFIFAGVLAVIFTIWRRQQRLAPPGSGA